MNKVLRFNNDYWHKVIIEHNCEQIKNILLEWNSLLISSPLNSQLPQYFSKKFKSITKNLPLENNKLIHKILKESPFLSIHHLIKDFLMKQILKIVWQTDDNITQKKNNINKNSSKNINMSSPNLNACDKNDKPTIHPMYSMYMKTYATYTYSFQKINGLLTYLKIIDYVNIYDYRN